MSFQGTDPGASVVDEIPGSTEWFQAIWQLGLVRGKVMSP